MKTIRPWLLLLLVAVLPLRGAVAAAMLCPAFGASTATELRVHEHTPVDVAMDHGVTADPAGHHAEPSGVGHHPDGQDSPASDRCNLCSASCSLTPMASDAPRLPEPLAPAAVKFAAVLTPVPSFVCGGQERPPRTL